MEQIAEQITQNLLQGLPDQTQFFTPNELRSAGIPPVVVQMLRKNVLSAIQSEIKLPETEWVQAEHERVQEAWQNFMETSQEYLQIPASKLSYLLAEAVEQCLELALKPRQSVPEIIFRTSEIVDFETVKKRVDSLEVNNQLGLALLRYMEKKEKREMTLEKARELVKKVDQRLVESYHPLNWAQALKPVFDLAGPSVDTDLFRIFFEDKEKPAYARKFDLLDDGLTETEFIEALSSADMLDLKGYEEEQPKLFVPVEEDNEPEKIVEIEEKVEDEYTGEEDEKVISFEDDHSFDEEDSSDEWVEKEQESASDINENFAESDIKDNEEQEDQKAFEPVQMERMELADEKTLDEEQVYEKNNNEEEEDRDENIVDLFSQIKNDDLFEEDRDEPVLTLVEDDEDSEDGEDNITLLSKFMFDDSVDDALDEVPDEPKPMEEKEPTSIYEEMNLVKDDHDDVREKKNSFEEAVEGNEETEEELSFKIDEETEEDEQIELEEEASIKMETDESEEDEDDQPMWRSFLERDDLETDSGYEYGDESDDEEVELEEDEFTEEEDDGFIEDPIYDLTTDGEVSEEKIGQISKWLDDEKDRFVEEIFMGSELAYEEALIEIIEYDNWKAASMYLEREVFSRNKIDVYDEAAVDFTDRLHSYFLEHNPKRDE
jgi:hypothetical protein